MRSAGTQKRGAAIRDRKCTREEEEERRRYVWEKNGRPEQQAPEGDWNGWLILAGRGWGKTRSGAEFIKDQALDGLAANIALISETSSDARNVMVEGPSGILKLSDPDLMPLYEPSKRRLTWYNGATATLFDACVPDQLRGPQHDLVWFDELAKYRRADDVFEQAMMGLRLGDHPRWIATTTPRPIPLIKRLMAEKGVVVTRGRTVENLANLAPTFRRAVVERYAGTRLGRQELDAEILEDMPGALWSRRVLDEGRVGRPPEMMRVVVGVDPAASEGPSSNLTGIVVMGLADCGGASHGYVLEDWSLSAGPAEWGARAVAAYREFRADILIAESNQGGLMVEQVIRSVGDIPVKLVHATRGKYVRAEPIAALYEQGRIHHAGVFPELEDQMVCFTPEGGGRAKGSSPDRVDALVWAATELFPDIVEQPRAVVAYAPVYSVGGWMA